MNHGGNSFSPKVMGRLVLVQHGSCHLNDRSGSSSPPHHFVEGRKVRRIHA
jgi:hypothetical protein